jgi:hypothetical protein
MQKPKKGGGKIMKKITLISGMVLILSFLISQGLSAQRYYRNDSRIEDNYYDLNLTQEQMKKIDKLELELEKEITPLISKLRSNYKELDELEALGSYDPNKIKKIWDMIYKLEDDIRNKEISHENKIRDLLTEEQRAIFDSYYSYGLNPYGRGGFGGGYFGSRLRGYRGANYGYGRYSYGPGIGRSYLGRGAGRLGRGYYGYGRGIGSGFGVNRRYFGLGPSRFSGPGNYSRFRYGRGPCGAGLGKWYQWDYGRGRWNWDE